MHVPAENPEGRKKGNELLERVLLNAKAAFEFRMSGNRGRMHTVLDPCGSDPVRKREKLKKCQCRDNCDRFHDTPPMPSP